jgi:ATP-dependent DNA helicase RecG
MDPIIMVPMLRVPDNPNALALEDPVQYVRGVGPRRSEQLQQHGIGSVGDLLNYAPFRYEDRTQYRPIRSLQDSEWVLVRGVVCSVSDFQTRRRSLSIIEVVIKDATGSIVLKFFNQPYLRRVYRVGLELVVYGQVRRDDYTPGSISLTNPECEVLDRDSGTSANSGRVVPIYRKVGQLAPRTLRQIISSILGRLDAQLQDPLPGYLIKKYRLLSKAEALARLHFPKLRGAGAAQRALEVDALNRGISPAHRRLMFEELFELQVGLRSLRAARCEVLKNRVFRVDDRTRDAIKKILPFHPTAAQKKVLREIVDDLRSPRPMSRLLQGDVGAGKTIVAAQAAVIAVESGCQVALMAPTEILAEQHYFYFRRLLAPLGYGIALLKGSLPAPRKREVLASIRAGQTQIAIGTHALIQGGVEFRNLALTIIDEQHRFGVLQRSTLKAKGVEPDLLVMTATPIPRSLALTLYGDLDVSVIDELPPGRQPIETRCCSEDGREEIYREIRRAVAAGHQVYVVYPLVEESEKMDLKAATEMAQHLKRIVFPDLTIGLLHGRMTGSEKEQTMADFAAGRIKILASTTVIEVGVDVANATLMVIEHAERFGLAQLHQLRGRVGRGAARSLCLLVSDLHDNPEAKRRLEIMCETNDGFRIAEVDLELRGPGEVAGTRQSGIPAFRYANLIRDRKALQVARMEADRLIELAAKDAECCRVADRIRGQWLERYGTALVG